MYNTTNITLLMNLKNKNMVSDDELPEFIYKILVVGDIGTGKTSIIKKYVHNIFLPGYKSTIGVDFAMKTLTRENESIKLLLWDIAGQERFTNMTRIYYKDAHAAIIVFDISRQHTFDSIMSWLNDIKIKLGDTIPIYIFANKYDIAPEYDTTDLEEFCKKNNISAFYKTSARNGDNIIEAIDSLANLLLKNDISYGVKKQKSNIITLDQNKNNNSNCCSLI